MANLSITTKGRNFVAVANEVAARTQDELDLCAQRVAIRAQHTAHRVTGASAESVYVVTPSSNGYRASTVRARGKVKEWNSTRAGIEKQTFRMRHTKTLGMRYHKDGKYVTRKRKFMSVGSVGACPKGTSFVTASGRFAHMQEYGQSRRLTAHPFIGPAAEAEAGTLANRMGRLIK